MEGIGAHRPILPVLLLGRFGHEFLENHLQNCRGRHGEDRADDAQQRSAKSSAMMTMPALTPTCRSMTFGTSTWFSICCCTRKKIATNSAVAGETGQRDADCGNRREDRSDDGIISPRPAISAST